MSSIETFRPEPGTLPLREDIPDPYKWDLSAICADWDEWQCTYETLERAIEAFAAFQGTLGQGGDQLLKVFRAMDEIGAMEFLLDKMKNTKSNDEFFASMRR